MVAHPADHELGERVERQLGRLAAQDVGHGHLSCTIAKSRRSIVESALLSYCYCYCYFCSASTIDGANTREANRHVATVIAELCIAAALCCRLLSFRQVRIYRRRTVPTPTGSPDSALIYFFLVLHTSITILLFLRYLTHQKVGGCDRGEVGVESEHDDRRKSFLGGGHPVRSFVRSFVGAILSIHASVVRISVALKLTPIRRRAAQSNCSWTASSQHENNDQPNQ